MIRVTSAPEPGAFNDTVRVPGLAYLNSLGPSQIADTGSRPYWREALSDLHVAYSGICAYSSHWIPYDVGSDTVEHFIPKSVAPSGAYEWANFRLACARLNGRKGAFQDVVDPFKVAEDMFFLHLPTFCLVPGDGITSKQSGLARSTIERLRLNETRSVQMRQRFLEDYADGEITLQYLRRNAPFLGHE